MIPHVPANAEVITSGIEESMSFSLDAASTAHILNMLRSGVYKDPKMACIREYWCNARDSVVEAGGDPTKDVIITLPTTRDPYYKIQDFGVGLSETDFRRIFRKYGASTKRESNEQIGQLGIGSKSAFSYSDTYTITAVKNGIKRVFIATVARDSVTADGVGSLNKVLETDTDERNGIEISIPIKDKDFTDFWQKTAFFFGFVSKKDRPIINGLNFVINERHHEDLGVENKGWRYTYQHRSYAIMGGVPYNLDEAAMDSFSEGEKALIKLGIDIEFPIGSLDPAISREELRYTEFTLKNLREKIVEIINIFSTKISDEIKSCRNLWEAKYRFRTFNQGSWKNIINNCLTNTSHAATVKWNNIEVTDYEIKIRQDGRMRSQDIYVLKVYRGSDGRVHRIRQDSWYVDTKEQPIIMMHDAKRYGEWQRMSTFLKKIHPFSPSSAPSPVYLIRFDTISAKDDFYKMNPGFDSLVTNSLIKQERDPKLVGKSKAGLVKTFTFDITATHPNLARGWAPADDFDEDSGGIYTHVDKFYAYLHYSAQNKEEFKEQLELLSKIGARIDTLWAVRPSIIDKIAANPDWVSYAEYIRDKLGAYLAKQNLNGRAEDAAQLGKLSEVITNGNGNVIGRYIHVRFHLEQYNKWILPKISPLSPLRQYVNDYVKINSALSKRDEFNDKVVRLFEKAGGSMEKVYGENPPVKSPAVVEFMKLAREVAERYPLLGFAESNIPTCPQVYIDYINGIDQLPLQVTP